MLFNVYLWTKIPRRRIFGTLRVMAYGLVVTAGLGALTVRNAVASAEDEGLRVGRQLEEMSDLLQSGTEFRLNNQRVFLASANTDETVSRVLDRFEANCVEHHAFDAMAWQALVNEKSKTPNNTGTKFGVIRKEDSNKGDGMVMCFTSEKGPRDFFKAIEEFDKTGNLSDLGDVRYVHAAPHKSIDRKTNSTHNSTFVQTMWTEGSFNIRSLTGPEDGSDSPGNDFVSLPRPINSTRRFTADAVGTPYGARVYESKSAPQEVLTDYDTRMFADNWIGVSNPTTPLPNGTLGHWYTKLETGEQAAIAIDGKNGRTMVGVASMGVLDKPPAKEAKE
ncbi:MAG TPA: hypothetical protein VH054_14825 [Polyangiaceae bacterium]|jgi:hypothetical protein|nr:hypothetical protein [Polyangiaceae bacterium]